MEIWILFLAFGFLDAMHPDPEFFSRTYDVSADEIRRALHAYKTSKVTTHLPTGEVEALGPGKVLIEDKQKTGIVTGVVSEEEMVDEAERLIKEACDKRASTLLES